MCLSEWLHKRRDCFAGPNFGTFTAVMAVATGVEGSLWSSQIRDSFELVFTHGVIIQNLECSSLIFWVMFVVTSASYLGHHRAQDSLREDTQKNLEIQVKLLQTRVAIVPELVRTQPESAFQSSINEKFEECYQLVEEWQDSVTGSHSQRTEAERVPGILAVLHRISKAIAIIMELYDRQSGAAGSYCANIMIFVKAEVAIRHQLPLLFHESEDNLLGHLLLTRSAQTTIKENISQASIEPISLPVPKSRKSGDGKRWASLPGAPFSFHEKEICVFADTKTVRDWCDKRGNLKPDMIDKVEKHFDLMRASFTGFASAPIFAVKPSEVREVVGVLNAHWLDARFFPEPKLAEDFMVTTASFRMLLGKVINYIQQEPSLLDEVILSRFKALDELEPGPNKLQSSIQA